MKDEKTVEFINWAKKKADWFDPMAARKDELFGSETMRKTRSEKLIKNRIIGDDF